MASNASHVIVRFAPSPNGYLHLGHAYSALKNFEFARRHGGQFLLRIEDIDGTRARPEFEQAIYDDLAWLGIDWQEPVRRQSEHMAEYAAALEALKARYLLYPCTCTRGSIRSAITGQSNWLKDPDGTPLYPGTCRVQGQGQVQEQDNNDASDRSVLAPAWRMAIDRALEQAPAALHWDEYFEGGNVEEILAEPVRWGDVILGRKDIGASYHMAVVVDDAAQGVTDVIRGMDLYQATSLHRLLQALLGLPAPRYRHHRLIVDDEHNKLSKSAGTISLRTLRADGLTAAEVRKRLGIT